MTSTMSASCLTLQVGWSAPLLRPPRELASLWTVTTRKTGTLISVLGAPHGARTRDRATPACRIGLSRRRLGGKGDLLRVPA